MSEYVEVYGTPCKLPPRPNDEDAINYGLPRKQQKWLRQPLPSFFDKVEYDKQGKLIMTPEQEAYADVELGRCREGVWIWIGERMRYITGRYYFYLQDYTLEDGNAPEFREADRLYYLFFQYWFFILWCLGIIRTKKRRQGASSQSCSNILYEAIFYKNSNCGLLSKTHLDSKDTFRDMITTAYQMLPPFFKQRLVGKEDSVTELILAHDKGAQSKINYRAPVLNAYDRGRMSYVLVDEGGKYPKETPVSKLLSIIGKTLIKGVKRVGWMDWPSTVNEMTKGGGAEYHKIWKNANQFKRKPTLNRLVRFFQPAYEAYEGFIDEFGDSVVDAPTEEQYEYLVSKWVVRQDGELVSELSEEDIRLGAKRYVMVKRREGLEGSDLEEEIRMNPCDEDEAFASESQDCAFNSLKIKKRIKELEENPVFKRDVIYYRKEDQSVDWRDVQKSDGSFYWRHTWLPDRKDANKHVIKDRLKTPDNTEDGVITVDSYSNSQGGRKYGSKACALIGRRPNLLDPENTGKITGMLYGRPKEKDDLHQQVLLAAEYHGYLVWYEHTADDYDGYFKDRGRVPYLGKYPKSLIDPTKRESAERHRGTPITPFSLTKQLDNGVTYFEHHSDKVDFEEILQNALVFEANERTSYDVMVTFLINVSCMMEPVIKPPPRKESLVKTYDNPAYAKAV